MPERIAAAMREEPKRGFGLAVGFAVLIAAVVLSVSWFSGSSGAAAKGQRVQHAAVHHAGAGHDRGEVRRSVRRRSTPTSIGFCAR